MALIKEHLLKIAFTGRFCYASILRRTNPLSDGEQVVTASTLEPEVRQALIADGRSCSDTAAAALVGKLLAERAKQHNVENVHFRFARDERYHGKLKALLDGVREAGLPLK
jgi:large subunit ribosomal protein L18